MSFCYVLNKIQHCYHVAPTLTTKIIHYMMITIIITITIVFHNSTVPLSLIKIFQSSKTSVLRNALLYLKMHLMAGLCPDLLGELSVPLDLLAGLKRKRREERGKGGGGEREGPKYLKCVDASASVQ